MNVTVPAVPGNATWVRRFSKSHVYVFVPAAVVFVFVLPLLS